MASRPEWSAAEAHRRALGRSQVTSMSLHASVKAKLETLARAAGKSRSAMVAQLVAREFEAAGLK